MDVEATAFPKSFRKKYSPNDIQRRVVRKTSGRLSESHSSLAGT